MRKSGGETKRGRNSKTRKTTSSSPRPPQHHAPVGPRRHLDALRLLAQEPRLSSGRIDSGGRVVSGPGSNISPSQENTSVCRRDKGGAGSGAESRLNRGEKARRGVRSEGGIRRRRRTGARDDPGEEPFIGVVRVERRRGAPCVPPGTGKDPRIHFFRCFGFDEPVEGRELFLFFLGWENKKKEEARERKKGKKEKDKE